MRYADIIIDISHEKLDKTFQYTVPADLEGNLQIGMQVFVSFGNGSRKIKGYIVDFSDVPKVEMERLKPIEGIVRDGIAPSTQLIALAAWMRSHYGGTMNQALKTVIPIKKKENIREKKTVTLLLEEPRASEEFAQLRARKGHSLAKERLFAALLEQPELPWEMITGKLNISSSVIREFEKRSWVKVTASRDYRNPKIPPGKKRPAVSLNASQQKAVDRVLADYRQNIFATYLLHGVTGSGKTEVYMELISHVLDCGREVIVLIPEIALTYQTLLRFYQRFGDTVSVINSRMSPGERFDQFERAKKGEVKIMIGPRSALFTPFSKLGLIIIDEEHEAAYKSETVPKYHARETAICRAGMNQASVVLGSATPSVESYYRACKGSYTLLSLADRAAGRSLPNCQIVDLRRELMEGNRSILSRQLRQLMEERLAKGQQMMLFVNRRGLMGFVSCRACGHVIKCPHCDVSLSLHKDGIMRCHYCGYGTPEPKRCPQCGSKYIGGFKAGTQKFEQVIRQEFPAAGILRMDMDTVKGKEGHQEILAAFAAHEADILIGTQMIVKGHDFPDVTLVGILAADLSLNANDYRSGERTFQLLTQAAGRSGRGDVPGDVVIQTYRPEHYSIVAAAHQDYEEFYRQEISYRKLMEYPPAAHLLVVQITSVDEAAAEAAAQAVAERLAGLEERLRWMGPADAAISRMKDVYRKVVYVQDKEYDRLIGMKDMLEASMATGQWGNVSLWFDFDPMQGF